MMVAEAHVQVAAAARSDDVPQASGCQEQEQGAFLMAEEEKSRWLVVWRTLVVFLPDLLWTVAYYVAFQGVCYLAVGCHPWLACLPLTTWSMLRVCLALESTERESVLRLVCCAVLIGWCLNTLLAVQPWSPITVVACARLSMGPDPLWMLTFWAGYAAFVDWVRPLFAGRWFVCVLLGAIFGPSSYLMGREIGALLMQKEALVLVAIEHGISFPVLIWLSTHFRARSETKEADVDAGTADTGAAETEGAV